MKSSKKLRRIVVTLSALTIAVGGLLAPSMASAAVSLKATAGGTLTLDYDRNAWAAFGTIDPSYGPNDPSHPGFIMTSWWDPVLQDYTTKTDGYFVSNHGTTEVTSTNLIHTVTPTGSNPSGQAGGRFVKGTTTNFSINSDTLAGTGTLGALGVDGYFLPYYGTSGGTILLGDWSLKYGVATRQDAWDTLGQEGTPSGWYLQNNISFSAVAFDLANLSVTYTDANNWEFKGDLLTSPENSDFLLGTRLTDVGNFRLGIGSYANTTVVPVPGAIWLFGTGLIGFMGNSYRKLRKLS